MTIANKSTFHIVSYLSLEVLTSNNSGHDPSRLFHRSVNKRNVPDYYSVIKEPMALSILKQKIRNRSYANFAEFVRDCALVSNAVISQQTGDVSMLIFH